MTLTAQTIALLEESILKLKKDLKPIEQALLNAKEGLYITHDSKSSIVVYISAKFKAYIPKRYDGWDVKTMEWKPDDELQLELDYGINLE